MGKRTMITSEFDYNDCLNYIENILKIKLFDFQKTILKAWCEDKNVRTTRGCGRSMLAEAFGKYIGSCYSYFYSCNDYSTEPDVKITYKDVIPTGLLSEDIIKKAEKSLPEEIFKRDYLCE